MSDVKKKDLILLLHPNVFCYPKRVPREFRFSHKNSTEVQESEDRSITVFDMTSYNSQTCLTPGECNES